MTEAALSKRIVDALNRIPGCHAEKVWTGGGFSRVGTPDITGAIRGRRFELETKVPGEKARKVQEVRLWTWARAGAVTGVVTSVDDALAIVEAIP